MTSATNLLFPTDCLYCGQFQPRLHRGLCLCGDCRRLFVWEREPPCPRCGSFGGRTRADRTLCSDCPAKKPVYDCVVSLAPYQEHLRFAILQMKSPQADPLSATMTSLLWQSRRLALESTDADAIVPVPMHWSRRMRRGTNSAEIMAEVLATRSGVPVHSGLLVRRRNTLPQGTLPRTSRAANVRGAFRLRGGYDIKGLRLLLVDDTLTTGATCGEAARVLKQAGATYIAVATLGRALSPD